MDFTNVQYNDDLLGPYSENSTFPEDNSAYAEMYPGDAGEAYQSGGEFPHDTHQADFGNSGEYQESRTVLVDGSDHFGVSAVSTDRKEELVWMGNSGGHVTSYLSTELMKYTSFQVHATEEIRDLRSIDPGILALTPTSLNLRTRQGMPTFTHQSPQLENMQCMVQLGGNFSNRLLLGGHQSSMVEYDLARQEQIRCHQVGEQGCVILRDHPRFVCHGDLTGRIVLHDPRTIRQEHSFQAHTGSLSDFDVFGNYIATCGFSNRMGQLLGDQFVMVFDLRMMKLSLPLRALVPPFLLKFLPGLSSCLAVISPVGQWQMMDAGQPDNSILSMNYQINCVPESVITTFDVAPSSQAIVFGDSLGSLHLFTSGSKPRFNNFSQETIMPDLPEQTQTMPVTDNTASLASLPMYYPTSALLSDWPEQYMKALYRPTPPVDGSILQSMKLVGSIGYAPNLHNKKRNQVPYKFSRTKGQKSNVSENILGKNEEGIAVHVPWRYRKIEIKYGKLGMDDFDYDQYNRTSFSGLDMSLPNSYCNPMIQMFYYIAPLRALMMSHLCEREFCLVCELGFLFHMLDVSMGQGIPCHASNFLRAFRTIPEASAMSLTLSDQDNRAKINFASKIQSWNRFVLQQLHTETLEEKMDHPRVDSMDERMFQMGCQILDSSIEEKEVSKTEEGNTIDRQDKREYSPVANIFGSHVVSINKCARCNHEIHKDTTSLLVNLNFPDVMDGSCSFSSVVELSMSLEQTRQAWCDSCVRYQPIEQWRRYKTLPNILAMNCGLDSAQDIKFWRNQFEILLTEIRDKKREEEKKNAEAKQGNNDKENNKTKERSTPSLSAGSPSTPSKRYPDTSTPQPSPARPCRYGQACTRHDCRFWHPGRDAGEGQQPMHVLSLLDQTMEYSWVPLGMRAKLNDDGTVSLSDISKTELENATEDETGVVYELVGVVSHIADPRFPDKNNLVSCIKVGPSYHVRAKVSSVSHWYLFNDISIQPIAPEEAVWFPCGWKTPCVLYWQRRQIPSETQEIEPINPVTVDVFGEDKSLAQRGRKRITFTPLTADEMPGEGDLVAMDAEFVNLHQEEAEIRSDGTRTTIKPSQKSVARITCIRGQGPLEGTPFLDDYISTQEQVVDYLTQFSGIKPGDLDANFSQKHLTTLKSTYVKLRYLVDKGVKFVGHGLKNDFRVINMTVPMAQLIDTVHLFHMSHNRMVSLKFLAWHFLKLKIQSVTHDSIEDARTALALYQKYCELKADGDLVMELQILYEAGKKAQWKVPGEEEEE
ncbi:PAN2-PAN3 deadenylation complex catalytic subunit PAN2-like isoform X2 [Homarus americanus]|uniref:PAN2-PAN3 deadenylation complex catalytic subunit PAN2-like isoform X2 n=1 Tax=Homarus americanus TaxID=6706 RepID=UPI001C48D820|nr:PAN2-PAN3 deadenylation complex catalytic subunit PAN2-like isoform X2 [Homarus americanus]